MDKRHKFYYKFQEFKKINELKWVSEDSNLDYSLVKLAGGEITNLARLVPILVKDFEAISLRITLRCHNKCVHCFLESPDYQNSLKVKPTLDQLKEKVLREKDTMVLVITGGEPLSRPDIIEFLEFCKENNKITVVESTLPGFQNPEKVKKYAHLIDTLAIPIPSIDKEVYESITQIPGSYDRYHTSIDNVIKYMPNTTFNPVITLIKPSLNTFYDTVAWAVNKFPHSPLFTGASCASGASALTTITPSFTEIQPHLQRALRDFGQHMTLLYTPHCFIYPYLSEVYIGDYNDPLLGSMTILDNKIVEEISNKNDDRYKPGICSGCYLFERCNGVRLLYQNLYDSALEVSPIHDEDFKEGNDKCQMCGRLSETSGKNLLTQYLEIIDEDGNVTHAQEPTTRTMCNKCKKVWLEKLEMIQRK